MPISRVASARSTPRRQSTYGAVTAPDQPGDLLIVGGRKMVDGVGQAATEGLQLINCLFAWTKAVG